MSSTRSDIRAAIVAALQAGVVGVPIVGPRDWPDTPDKLPLVIVQSPPHEKKTVLVKGRPEYETRGIFPITIRVARTTIQDADAALETIITQAETALFSWLPFQDLIEQVATVETRTVITAEASHHIAEAVMLLECEWVEFFSPSPGFTITEYQGTIADQTTGKTLGTFDVKV